MNIISKLRLSIAALSIIALSLLSACEADKCKQRGTICLNEGVCFDGVCNCPAGFEGDSCQYQENEKFAGVFEGVLLSSTGSSTLGTNDTLKVYVDVNNKSGIYFSGNKTPQAVVIQGTVDNNAVIIKDFKALNNRVFNGTGSFNGTLLTITMQSDSLNVNGGLVSTTEYTFAGNKL